jgi:1,4-dihydroxy-6-naphthoate synthase
MSEPLRLAISPCPNDTFIFDAIVHHKIDTEGLEFSVVLEDIDRLNRIAFQHKADIVKVSYHAFLYIQDRYSLLRAGSALGSGNGPLLVAKKNYSLEAVEKMRIAVPGRYTTAHLLFRIAFPGARRCDVMLFSEIEEAVANNRIDAGVIIHENRFTYASKGLVKLIDLGEFWENLTGAPIPLGGIVASRSLGPEMIARIDRVIRRSVQFAMDHPEEPMTFIRKHAQAMDPEVMKQHIGLYVNEFTLDIGMKGEKALATLRDFHREHGMQ